MIYYCFASVCETKRRSFVEITERTYAESETITPWELRESMKEAEIETILERAKEKYPEEIPRSISDNGPQFIARDF
jgi:hypothetical protein